LRRRIDFLRETFRNLKTTGSVARSSRFLCRHITEKIISEEAKVVLELGPGDGAITQFILEKLGPDTQILVFEVNDVFIQKLRDTFKDPRLSLIHDSAEHIEKYLAERGIESVDYIISGIPFAILPESLAETITRECHRWLRPGGLFIQFHYSPLRKQFYHRIFGNARVDFIPLNIPPAFVVTCQKQPHHTSDDAK
jgi:phospholipid N-methyltransferase